MAYSTQRTTSDGTLVALDLAIEYLDRSEIAVILDGVVSTAWSWVGTTEKRIEFPSALALGTDVLIVRTTDLSGVRHVFEGGAAFTYSSVDENYEQILHIAQEARENATLSDIYSDINMHGFQIKNTAPATEPTDLVTFSQFSTHDVQIITYRDEAAASAAAAEAAAGGLTPMETQVHAAAVIGAPADVDELGVVVASVDNTLRRITWLSVKTAIASAFASVFMPLVSPGASGNLLTSNGTAWASTAPAAASGVPTGCTFAYAGSTAPSGYVLLSGRTIGSATSAATERANADTLALYTLLWDSMSNTEAAVTGGRGASAAADFAANKPIALPDARGRALAGTDNMGGTLAGRITAAGAGIVGTTLGASGGAQTHVLTLAQMPSHTHTVPRGAVGAPATSMLYGECGVVTTQATSSQGSSAAHQNTQPTLVLNIIVKL